MKNKKAVIGISADAKVISTTRLPNYGISFIGEDYINSLLGVDAIPHIIPILDDIDLIKEQLRYLDGIILSGGGDIDPLEYNEDHLSNIGVANKKRDLFELRLSKLARELKLPTLCVCRGHQLVAVECGGTLYQDLSYDKNIKLRHDQCANRNFPSHKILIEKNSILFDIYKKKELMVNSFHHQTIKKLPKEFKVTALSSDGVIEAYEYKKSKYFFLSVQWHPEMMYANKNSGAIKIFQKLKEEAKKYIKQI